MRAKVEQAWIHARDDGQSYAVVVRIDVSRGKFIESIHHRREDAQARIKFLLQPDTLVETRHLISAS